MPADQTLYAGVLLIFGGRRWKVSAVDHAHKIIEAVPAAGGRPPLLAAVSPASMTGSERKCGQCSHQNHLRATCRPPQPACSARPRAAYARYQLADHSILQTGPHTLLFPWTGSRVS